MGLFSMGSLPTAAKNEDPGRVEYWRDQIQNKEDEIAELSLSVQEYRSILNTFMGEYNSRVGIHLVELRKIEVEIQEYKFRIEEVKKKIDRLELDDLDEIEKKLSEIFREEKEKIENMRRETDQSASEHREKLRKMEWADEYDPDLVKEIKAIYKKLALRYHPDKGANEDERAERTKIMSVINEAYDEGRLDILMSFLKEADKYESFREELKHKKLQELKNYYNKLCDILQKLQEEYEDLQACEAAQLMEKAHESRVMGVDFFGKMTTDTIQLKKLKKNQLEGLEKHFTRLKEEKI